MAVPFVDWGFFPRVPLAPLLYMSSGVVIGIVLVLVVQYWLLSKWWKTLEVKAVPDSQFEKARLHSDVQAKLDKMPRPLAHQIDELPTESCLWVNVLSKFLFQELKDTVPVRRFFLRVLERDLKTLRETSNVGSVLKKVTIMDLNFGTSMPAFEQVKLMRPKVGDLGDSQELDLSAHVSYEGEFHIKMDCDLLFGRKAIIAVTLTELKGRLKFSFRHFPSQHWTVSFFEEPVMKLDVSSTLQGRSVPQLRQLIASQIRRTVRKRHTLPAAKTRYAPFFKSPTEFDDPFFTLYGKPLHIGSLNVRVLGVSDYIGSKSGWSYSRRVGSPKAGTHSFCALSLENKDGNSSQAADTGDTFDVSLVKAGAGGSVGLQFQNMGSKTGVCRIESIFPASPASDTTLQIGDVILQVNGTKVANSRQAIKLIKQSSAKVTLKVSREHSSKEGEELSTAGDLTTHAVTGTKDINWNETFLLGVAAKHRFLYIRLCDCRLSYGKRTGKQYLMGFTEVNLPEAAFYCTATQAPFRQKFPLRASYAPAAPVVGQIELVLEITPEEQDPNQEEEEPRQPTPQAPQVFYESDTPEDTVSFDSETDEDTSNVGEELFADLPVEQRRHALEEMTNTVQAQIELEEETRADLERQLEEATTASNMQRLKANIILSGERKDLLYMRMLKCVSALQNCEEQLAMPT